MNRASPVELRQSLEMAKMLADAGIKFVPLPVENDAEFNNFSVLLSQKLERMAREAEKNEGGAA